MSTKPNRYKPNTAALDLALIRREDVAAMLTIDVKTLTAGLADQFPFKIVRIGERGTRFIRAEIEAWALAGCPTRDSWGWSND